MRSIDQVVRAVGLDGGRRPRGRGAADLRAVGIDADGRTGNGAPDGKLERLARFTVI